MDCTDWIILAITALCVQLSGQEIVELKSIDKTSLPSVTLNGNNIPNSVNIFCYKLMLNMMNEKKDDDIVISPTGVAATPDYQYLETTKAYYKFHTQATSWSNSKEICESEDATLFYPKNEAEIRSVTSFWKDTHENVDLIYLGIIDFLAKGNFTSIDGSPLTYVNWHAGEPNNATGNERCVLSYKDGTFIDDSCTNDHAYICKKMPRVVEQNKPCNMSNKDAQKSSKMFRSDYRYIEETQAFYKFHSPAKWTNAKQMCESENAKIFYPMNEAEICAVTSFWNETENNLDWIYIGITDLVVKGVYATIDGNPITYMKWRLGEPNNAGGDEDCVLSHKDGTFIDDSCLKDRAYICKKSLSELEWNKPCNIPYTDYVYNEEQGKCYKFHTKAMSWTEAYKTCDNEQAHLAVINSKRERDYLLNLTRPSSDQITEVLKKGKIHLGFHNRLDEGWQTLQGTTLEDSGYTHWDVDQPDGFNEVEKCGSMSYTGRLHDVECNSKRFFMCEHEIKKP